MLVARSGRNGKIFQTNFNGCGIGSANESTNQGKRQAGAEAWSKSRSVRQGDVVVTVAGAKTGSVSYRDLVNRPQFTVAYLTIALSVSNLSGVKKVDFETWRGAQFDIGRDTPSLWATMGTVTNA